MPAIPLATAAKVLSKEFKKLVQEPLEGFRIVKVDDADIYEWIVAIFGPPGTLYEGGYFKGNFGVYEIFFELLAWLILAFLNTKISHAFKSDFTFSRRLPIFAANF